MTRAGRVSGPGGAGSCRLIHCVAHPAPTLVGLLEMALDTIALVAAFTAVLAFLWNLHRDMGALNKDMGALRQDMNRDMGALRQDMNRDMGGCARTSAISATGCREWKACWREPG